MMQKIENVALQEAYYCLHHSSGLTVYVYPKAEWHSTYAVIGTNYGSVDVAFCRSDTEKKETLPAGTAHFLEHKLFESEDGDAFARFAELGASANAYTGFLQTCYLFSCTQNTEAALEVLLDFVQHPYFTEETVRKEQGIIRQEIKMYEDSPGWRVMFNLLEALYHTHPVKTDIAGTAESIAQITPACLYRCYDTFYNLHNMVLCIAGQIDPAQVEALCDRLLQPSEPVQVERLFAPEPRCVVKKEVSEKLPVAYPLFELGYKEDPPQNADEKLCAASDVLLDILASDSSVLFNRLLEAGLIDESSFGCEYFEGTGFSSAIFSGESRDPYRAAAMIREEIARLKETGVPEEEFQRAKRAVYGDNVSSLNSIETIAGGMVSLHFSGRELFRYIDAVTALTRADVEKRLHDLLQDDYSALSIVWPL